MPKRKNQNSFLLFKTINTKQETKPDETKETLPLGNLKLFT
jgi:hypothetical protein